MPVIAAAGRKPVEVQEINPVERLRLERRSHGKHGTGLAQLAIKALAVKEAIDEGDWRAKVGALEDVARLCVQWRRVILEEEAPAWVRQANRL